MHHTTDNCWKYFKNLPSSIQILITKNFKLLKSDPQFPSLHFKKIGKFWSTRVGSNYRALALEDGDNFIWVWIGSHDEYERIIRNI